jgi:hypothetical protein
MDDISPAARRMTYAELAEARDEAAGLFALNLDAQRGLRRRLRWALGWRQPLKGRSS